jgi:hypothetical protein
MEGWRDGGVEGGREEEPEMWRDAERAREG